MMFLWWHACDTRTDLVGLTKRYHSWVLQLAPHLKFTASILRNLPNRVNGT